MYRTKPALLWSRRPSDSRPGLGNGGLNLHAQGTWTPRLFMHQYSDHVVYIFKSVFAFLDEKTHRHNTSVARQHIYSTEQGHMDEGKIAQDRMERQLQRPEKMNYMN